MTKPNFLFLTIDTLRTDRLGCYGQPRPLTPHIDRLAEKGIRFSQAVTGGSWTQAAFPVMLTSTYASMHGGCMGPLSPGRPSPVSTLSESGYITGGFSTNPLLSKAYAYDRGFDYFADLVPSEQDPWLRKVKGGHALLKAPLTHRFGRRLGKRTRPAKVYASGGELTDQICEWIDGVEEPFFAWAHYMDVHWPYHIEDELEQPAEIAQAWRDLVHLHEVNWAGGAINEDHRQHYIQLYERALVYLDAQIGRLLDFLDESGKGENTVIILVADHGEEFLEHKRWGHWENNLHDEILLVPLLIQVPGKPERSVVSRQVRTLDLMPTVLDLCGITPEPALEGESLLPLWNGWEDHYRGDVSVSEMWREHWHIIAVRTESFKYIWDSRQPDQPILYDLQKDPEELQDVSDRFPEVIADLHPYVRDTLEKMDKTSTVGGLLPEPDAAMRSRLRDLGYIE